MYGMKHLSLILSFLFAISFTCTAQSNNDSIITISGKVVDEDSEPVINALVELLDSNNTALQTTNTDYDDEYLLQVGNSKITYKIMVRHLDYTTSLTTDVHVDTKDTFNQNFKLRRQEGYQEIIINIACPSIIDRDNPSPMNKTITSDQIEKTAH